MKISCVSNEKMPQLYFVSLYSNVLFCYETNMPKSLMCFFVTKIIKYKQPIWQRPVFCKLKTPTLKRKTRGKRQGWASVLFKRTFRSFIKNVPFFPFFSVLYKRTFRSFRSFPFFIKERNILFRSFPNLTNLT